MQAGSSKKSQRAGSRDANAEEGTAPSLLSTELGEIEQAVISGHMDAVSALQEIVEAVAAVEGVSGVDIALSRNGHFVSVARLGSHPDAVDELYGDCLAGNRMLRCDDAAQDARMQGQPFASARIFPLSSRGSGGGVLGVFSDHTGAFGPDHIVPLSTAATLCAVLAPQVLEKASDLPAPSHAAELEKQEKTHGIRAAASHLLSSLRHNEPADKRDMVVTQIASGSTGNPITGQHLPKPESNHRAETRETSSPVDSAGARGRQEHEIRSLITSQSPRPTPSRRRAAKQEPSPGLLQRPLVLVPMLLVLSGMVFGSMHFLRSAKAAPNAVEAQTTASLPSFVINRTLGSPILPPGLKLSQDTKIKAGSLTQEVKPVYPADALRRSVGGEVEAMLLISDRGAVTDVQITGGNPAFAATAAAALSHWRFSPFQIDQRAISVQLPVTISFEIVPEGASQKASK